jgi:hypothetical protein
LSQASYGCSQSCILLQLLQLFQTIVSIQLFHCNKAGISAVLQYGDLSRHFTCDTRIRVYPSSFMVT